MKKGSLTIFSAMCMMFVISALFVLLEAARVYGLNQYGEWKSEQGIEYAAAEYQPYLWSEYQLLMLDGGYGTEVFDIGKVTGRVRKAALDRTDYTGGRKNTAGADLFELQLSHIYEPEYVLVTDEAGTVFLDMLASYMEKKLPKQIAREVYEKFQNLEQVQKESPNIDEAIDKAQNSIEAAREDTENIDIPQMDENPFEVVKEIKSTLNFSTIGFIIPDVETVSTKTIDFKKMIENRELQAGNTAYDSESDWYRKMLSVEYIMMHCSRYGKESEGHALDYELEFIIGGKNEDRKNLEEVINRLLLSRTAANISYLLSDAEKMADANAIAMTLAGFSGNPAIVKAVEIAIVGAWAFLEGVQDVRALLMGGKIALIKTAEQWTTNLFHLKESFHAASRAKECKNGWRYDQYLRQILFFMENKTLAYRMLNIMEQNLRATDEYKDCRMDDMIVSFNYRMEFSATPLFSTMSLIEPKRVKEIIIQKEKGISYMP